MIRYLLATAALCALIVAGVVLFNRGQLRFNYPQHSKFPVWGVDVSHHQGRIDWPRVRAAGFEFAFIKASEGQSLRDKDFAANWAAAEKAGVSRGAYHFFTFCTPAALQAANFIAAVPAAASMLPPAVDVEFSGNCANPPPIAQIRSELQILLMQLELAYGRKPILYVTRDAYARIVEGGFADYPLWVRNVFWRPHVATPHRWLFWQFADRSRIDGVRRPVDLNVFHGSRAAFDLCLTQSCP